jgi:hypothetical protein
MTKNLFRDIQSIEELQTILARHPKKPLLPVIGSEPWEHTAKNSAVFALTKPLRERALEECGKPMPSLMDELYASFRATGKRLTFENVYFERRRQLGRAAITLLLAAPTDPQRAALTASVLDKFTDIFEEVSWALNAHVNWHNDDVSGKEPMQIDLFCAETANLMSEMLDLFGDAIPAKLQACVRERLRTHVWENYTDKTDGFHWTKVTHNWNAVCHQGVIGSALSQLDDMRLLARMLWQARQSLKLFLGGFTADGGCTEGIGYWSYGFGWFTVLNEQLETRTDGELSLFEGDEHVRKIAQFAPRMALTGRKLVNFSDNGAEGTLSGPIMAYLGARLNDPACLQQSTVSYRELVRTGIFGDEERCDVFFLGRLTLRCPESIPASDDSFPPDCFLPNLAVLVAHGKDAVGRVWDFAAKAGHNEEHHNHNDCAAFLLNVAGLRFVSEIGAPEYTKDFFSDKRYENIAARSLGHSVPRINGAEQANGAEFTSTVVSHSLSPKLTEFTVDATRAYPASAACRRFVRTLRFEKPAGKLRVEDVFELDRTESLESSLVSIYPIVIKSGRAFIRAEGLELVVRPEAGTRLERVEVHSYSARKGVASSIQRLVWVPETISSSCSIAVELELSG